jgi:hypothetical protein
MKQNAHVRVHQHKSAAAAPFHPHPSVLLASKKASSNGLAPAKDSPLLQS